MMEHFALLSPVVISSFELAEDKSGFQVLDFILTDSQ